MSTLKDLMNESFSRFEDRTAIRILRQLDHQELQYIPMTYKQLKEQRDRMASGLGKFGLEKGQRVGILTDGGLESVLVFLASDLLGLSSVPLCNKLPDDLLIHSMNCSRLVLLFVDPKSWEQVERIKPHLDNPPQLVLTEGQAEGAWSFFDLIKEGAHSQPREIKIYPEDESKVVFTSGSSGLPKGVIQTHQNLVGNVKAVWNSISKRETAIFFKSAPDYHTMGILNIYYPLAKGWTLDLARSPDRVLVDIRYSEPHGFLTVPLILDKVYGNVRKEIQSGGIRGRLIERAVKSKQRLSQGKATLMDRMIYETVGKKIVGQIRDRLSQRVGGRLELLVVGSAKADPEALDFFQEVLDITSFEGYGVTECSPLIAANTLSGQKTGTVGRPLQEVKLVAADGQEVGYGDPSLESYRSSGEEVGELWVHGDHVMAGYLNDPKKTSEVLVKDRTGKVWYRTGDLFSIDEEGFLTFQGRIGRQFKLRNGEFVNPERLERLYGRVPLIEHVLVYGDQDRTFPLPMVTVSTEEAKIQTGIENLPMENEAALRRHPVLAERIREQMLWEATQAGLPGHERPKKILVIPEPFSEETGTLTRGLKKIVPEEIEKRYRSLIEEAYAGV